MKIQQLWVDALPRALGIRRQVAAAERAVLTPARDSSVRLYLHLLRQGHEVMEA